LFGHLKAGYILRLGGLTIQPSPHSRVRLGLHRFGDDVGIEDDHSKLSG
jgi:hypothetical protein